MTLDHYHTYWKKGISTWNSQHSGCGMESFIIFYISIHKVQEVLKAEEK
jgi:hypothetical protein